MSSDYIARLRHELVEAAAREQAGRGRMPALARVRTWSLPRPRTIAIAAAAVVVALVVVLSAVRIGTDEAPPVEQPPPARLDGRPLFGGSLEPRVRYVTRALKPQLSFSVADDRWFVRDATAADGLVLERRQGKPGGETASRSFLAFGTPSALTDPETGRDIPAPRDLLGWLRDHPDIRAGRSGRTTVAGMPATYLDTTVSFATPTQRETRCDTQFLGRFDESGRRIKVVCTKLGPDLGFTNGWRTRWLAVETGGSPFFVTIEGWTRRDYERVQDPAERVLDSLRISR